LRPRVDVASAVRARVPRTLVHRLENRLRHANARISRLRRGVVAVRICDDAEIARLNLRTMGHRGPTDVLSYPTVALPGLEAAVLGDIVVSWDAVLRQSVADTPQGWLEEISQLVIHGLAHLHGHDHATRGQGRAMLRAEQRAARAARVGRVARPYG
jgi:probable rRNA maturation factor